jgi:hypothetical protein
MFAALVLIRRLTALELGSRVASATVELIAFGPMAIFLSAVYTDSLFLALSAGTFYAARRGRWATAGLLGGLAAVSRIGGVLLFVPVVILFLYGPRADATARQVKAWWRPRYRFGGELLWALVIPLSAMVFAAFLASRGYGTNATLHAQESFSEHRIMFPLITVWNGLVAAFGQLKMELAGVNPVSLQTQALFGGVVLIGSLIGIVGVFRRLPFAYGAYVSVALLQALASPTIGDPLRGLDRYASLRFPLFMWAAAWAVDRGVERKLVLASAVLLVLFTAQFATWHVVGTPQL